MKLACHNLFFNLWDEQFFLLVMTLYERTASVASGLWFWFCGSNHAVVCCRSRP